MTHVSRKKLPKEMSDLMNEGFIASIKGLDTSGAKSFATNLLTTTELEMLSKRLFVIYILNEKYSITEISNTVNTTIQTVQRIQFQLVSVPKDEIQAMVNKVNGVIGKKKLKAAIKQVLDTEVRSQTLEPFRRNL